MMAHRHGIWRIEEIKEGDIAEWNNQKVQQEVGQVVEAGDVIVGVNNERKAGFFEDCLRKSEIMKSEMTLIVYFDTLG